MSATEAVKNENVQQNLLELLNQVSALPIANVGPLASGEIPPAGVGCPQCGDKAPWGTNSWCGKCGYYPALGRKVAGVEQPMQDTNESENDTAVDPEALNLPAWVPILLGGCLLIIVANILFRLVLPLPGMRGPIGLLQLLVGGTTMLFAHLRAFGLYASLTPNASPLTAITSPQEAWKTCVIWLPKTRKVLYSLVWGLTACVSAPLIVGLEWEYALMLVRAEIHSPDDAESGKEDPAAKKPKSAEDSAAPEPGSMTFGQFVGATAAEMTPEELTPEEKMRRIKEAIDKKANAEPTAKTNSSSLKEKSKPKKPAIPIIRTMVGGYTTNQQGEIKSLILATGQPGNCKFVAKLAMASIPNEEREQLQQLLPKLRTKNVTVTNYPSSANWVTPAVSIALRKAETGSGIAFHEILSLPR